MDKELAKGLYRTLRNIVFKNVSSQQDQKGMIYLIQDLFQNYPPHLKFNPILPSRKNNHNYYDKQKLYSSFFKTLVSLGLNPVSCPESFGFYKKLTDIIDEYTPKI